MVKLMVGAEQSNGVARATTVCRVSFVVAPDYEADSVAYLDSSGCQDAQEPRKRLQEWRARLRLEHKQRHQQQHKQQQQQQHEDQLGPLT